MRKLLSTIGILLLLLPSTVGAVTSYVTFNVPPTRLKTRMDTTQTTGIKLNPPSRNGADVSWPAQSGGIVLLQQGTREELIYYSRATVAADKVVTLTGTVIRDIPWNLPTSFTGQGDGQFFHPGAAVTFVVSAQTLNLKVDLDRPNILTASGAIAFSGSGSFTQPYFATTAIRDRQLGTNPRRGSASCTDDTGQCYDFMAGAWRSRSGSNIINGSETAAGKVQLATISHMSGATATDAVTGAPLVVQARYMTASGGSTMRKRGALLDNRGFLSGSLLGTGVRTSTGFLAGDQTFKRVPASGATLAIDQTLLSDVTGLASTTFAAIDSTNLSGTISFSVGDVLMVTFSGRVARSAGDPEGVVIDFQVGNNPITPNNSGSLVIRQDQTTEVADTAVKHFSITRFLRIATGSALTIRPVYRIQVGGGGQQTRFNGPTHFQAIKIH